LPAFLVFAHFGKLPLASSKMYMESCRWPAGLAGVIGCDDDELLLFLSFGE
jgi:hypothetical protein